MNGEQQTNPNQQQALAEQPVQQPIQPQQPAPTIQPNKDVEKNKAWAFIGYLGILSLVVLLAKKDSPYAHYHAKQGFVLFLISAAIYILDRFVYSYILSTVFLVLNLAIVVLIIVGIINALSGKQKPLPLFGKMAEGVNI